MVYWYPIRSLIVEHIDIDRMPFADQAANDSIAPRTLSTNYDLRSDIREMVWPFEAKHNH